MDVLASTWAEPLQQAGQIHTDARVVCIERDRLQANGWQVSTESASGAQQVVAGFDAVLLAFVLHHCPDPAAVLREAAHVSCGPVLVLEDGDCDLPPGRAERLTDALINLEFGHPHGERSRLEWLEIFAACGLGVQHEQGFVSRFGGLRGRHRLYVLRRL